MAVKAFEKAYEPVWNEVFEKLKDKALSNIHSNKGKLLNYDIVMNTLSDGALEYEKFRNDATVKQIVGRAKEHDVEDIPKILSEYNDEKYYCVHT